MLFPSALEALACSRGLIKFWTNRYFPRRITFWISVTHLCTLVVFLCSFVWIITLFYLFFFFINSWPRVCEVLHLFGSGFFYLVNLCCFLCIGSFKTSLFCYVPRYITLFKLDAFFFLEKIQNSENDRKNWIFSKITLSPIFLSFIELSWLPFRSFYLSVRCSVVKPVQSMVPFPL